MEHCNQALDVSNQELYRSSTGEYNASSLTQEKAFDNEADHDDSGSSGIGGPSPASSGSPSDDEEVNRSAEATGIKAGEVTRRMEELERKAAESRSQGRVDTGEMYRELARLNDLLAQEARGKLGICLVSPYSKSVPRELHDSIVGGSLAAKTDECLTELVTCAISENAESVPNIKMIKTGVKPFWKKQEQQGIPYDGIIKVSAEELKMADDYVLQQEEGSEGAFEHLCNYIVNNKRKMDPIVKYLNSIGVQVYNIRRGCIELGVRCFDKESADHLQDEESIESLKAMFQSQLFHSALLKQFGLESLELKINCKFSPDTTVTCDLEEDFIEIICEKDHEHEADTPNNSKTEEAPPQLTAAQTTSVATISGPPTTASLQTYPVATGTPENKEIQEEDPASNTALTKGLDCTTSVDNLAAPPSPMKHVEHSNLRGLFLAMGGGKDQSCADASDDGSRLNFTVRQVQTALQKRSKKAQQRQMNALEAAREGTDGIIHSLRREIASLEKEVTRLTQEKDKAQTIILDHKQQLKETKETNENLPEKVKSLSEKDETSQKILSEKNLEIQQLQEANKTREDKIEKLTIENKRLTQQLPDLQYEVKRLTEKDKTSQTALLEKNLEIQLLQETNKDMAARIEERLSAKHLVEGEHQGGASRKEKRDSGTEKRQFGPEDASEVSVKEKIQDTAVMPSDVSVTHTREDSIRVTWGAAAENTDYYLLTISGGDADMSLLKHTDVQHFTFGGLIPGTQYSITVRAVTGCVMSEEVKILQRTNPAQAGEISIANITENSISITWAEATGNKDCYSISISPADCDNPAASVNDGDPLEYSFTGLTPGTLYTISVTTVSGGVKSLARTKEQWITQPVQDLPYVSWANIKLSKKIGEGTFGTVHMGTLGKETVAVKVLGFEEYPADLREPSNMVANILREEANVMLQIQTENVVKLIGVCMEKGHYSIIMEYMPRGTLPHVLQTLNRQLSWPERLLMCLDAARGLRAIHHPHGHYPARLHGHLSSDAFLVNNELRVKLSDFCTTKTRSSIKRTCRLGLRSTVAYLAPEHLKEIHEPPDFTSEVYSFGIIMWEIVSQRIAHQERRGVNETSICKFVLEEEGSENLPADCSPQLKDIIDKCRSHEPMNRPQMTAVVTILEALNGTSSD